MHRVRDPVDSGVPANLKKEFLRICSSTDPEKCAYSFVVGVDEDNLEILVDTVLVDPIGVENPQVSASSSNSLLGKTPQSTLELELVDTLADGLSVGGTYDRGVDEFG